MRIFVLIGICLLGIGKLRVHAQTGKVYMNEETSIRMMLDHRKGLNFEKDRTVKAWSVQVMITRDKYEVNKRKYEVQRRFNDVKVDWVFEDPYYRLNAGAFYTKLEAAQLLNKLNFTYPDAYIFKNSKVKPGDL
ncbi:MAG: sporulation protein [Saprospiraceae bacterium]|nr:sporulation protein [Saprospiraceae bacterium]